MRNDRAKFDEEADDDCEAFYADSDYAKELWEDIFADPANIEETPVEDIFSDEFHSKYCMCPLCEEYNSEAMELDFPGLFDYSDDSDTDEHRRESEY